MPWAPSYASTDELREFVRIGDSLDDIYMSAALDAASRMIDSACDPRADRTRQFGQTDDPEPRYYTATVRGYSLALAGQWVAETDDLADPLGPLTVEVYGGSAWVPVTGCEVLPYNAAAVGWPGTSVLFARSSMPYPPVLADAVRITAVWGWPGVPLSIKEACLIQANRLLSRRDAPFGVAGSPETGTEIRLLAKLDPDVEAMVRPFSRKLGAVLA